MFEELKELMRLGESKPTTQSIAEFHQKATILLRDHGQALVEALDDVDRMNQLELSQRADVYWHENGDQELAGYEWGTGGQYSTARDALDASILARTKAGAGGGV